MKRTVTFVLVVLSLLAVLTVGVSAGEYPGVSHVITLNANADNIIIDGKINSGEWGKPILTVTPQSVDAKYNMGWEYVSNTSELPTDQQAEIYVVNEGNTIYVACKLIGVDYDDAAKSVKELTNHPHFGFSIATYDKNTVVPWARHAGKVYEKYGHFMVGLVDGRKAADSRTSGMDIVLLKTDDYEASYDKATRTYTYEVRVADGSTPVDLAGTGVCLMAFDIGGPSNGKTANRYLLSRAAERAWAGMGPFYFAHAKTNPILIKVSSTADMVTNEFVAASDPEQQIGSIYYEDVQRNQQQKTGISLTAVIIAAAVTVVLVALTVLVIVRRKKS